MYLCKTQDTESYQSCSAEYICDAKDKGGQFEFGLDYIADKDYKYYLDNWFLQMDQVCTPPVFNAYMMNAYWFAYFIGGVFYTFPDKYGR